MNALTDRSASDRVFATAADLFSLLSAPTRLRIVCELSKGERNVGELLQCVGVSQPNISQHLGLLYRGGVVARRRSGAHVFYRITSEHVQLLCDAVGEERESQKAHPHRAVPVQ
jgi:DNA-binding transcriptional ArsR family regulator